MSDNKTVANNGDVDAFIAAVQSEEQRADAERLVEIMSEETGETATMWGPSIVGFGSYHYRYESGREGDSARVSFSPRKGKTSIYIMSGFEERRDLMERLGKFKTGTACLYVKRLSDIDEAVLRELIRSSLAWIDKTYPSS